MQKSAATVEIGSGRDEFEKLRDGSGIDLIHGPQGGYHLLLNARIFDMDPGDPTNFTSGPLTLFAIYAGEERLDEFTCAIKFPYTERSTGFVLDRPLAVIIPNDRVPSLYGTNVVVETEVLDHEGRYGRDRVTVLVLDPEADPYLFPAQPRHRAQL